MNRLLKLLSWDLRLIAKYGIAMVALIITSIYCVTLLLADTQGAEKYVVLIAFSDPVMYGFLFTAVMILFEKDANIHQVLAVTPLPEKHYLISKSIAFTILALICSFCIILSAQPQIFHPFHFAFAVIFSSVLFVFIGVIGVSFVANFNQFILLMPLVLTPVCLPFLDYLDLYNSWIFYLIPTQACLLLFEGSLFPIENWQFIYAYGYLSIWLYFCYKWAIKAYQIRILKTNRDV